MNVALFSCDARETNGWGSITLNLCRAYFRRQLPFTLYLPQNHPRLEEPFAPFVRYELPTDALVYSSVPVAKALLSRPPSLHDARIVHSLFATPIAISAERAARRARVPFLLGEQGTYAVLPFQHPLKRFIFKKTLHAARKFIFPSEFTRSLFLNFLSDPSYEPKTVVIPNGVQSRRFSAQQRPDRFHQKSKAFIGVGGLKPRKGFDLSIRAIAPILRERPEVSYRIIGTGPTSYLQTLRDLARAESIENQVFFCGELRGAELDNEFRQAFAYLHLPVARSWQFEGFGIVFVEASAAGLPVVASLSGGVPSAVIHRETGLLSPEGDISSATEHCRLLLNDESLYHSLSRGGSAWGISHDWDRIAEQFIREYDELFALPSTARHGTERIAA